VCEQVGEARPKATEGWLRRGKRWSTVNPSRPHVTDGKANVDAQTSAGTLPVSTRF
jgi:hypothetical protein